MHSVFVFLTKLGLFVGSSVGTSGYLGCFAGGIVIRREHTCFIPALQVLLAAVMLVVYTACATILATLRQHQQYDAVEEDTSTLESEGAPAASQQVLFASPAELDRHVFKVHATGFLLWTTMVAFDYAQPELAFFFTVGAVGAWLLEMLQVRLWSDDAVSRLEVADLVVFICCYCMIAAIYLGLDAPPSHEDVHYSYSRLMSVMAGVSWPVFFRGRPHMILYTIHSSLYTLVLLCIPVVLLHVHGLGAYSRTSVLVLLVVQPIVKIMCVMILCLSIRTGHKLDLVVALTVACFAQYVYMAPLDSTHRALAITSMVLLVLVHVLAMHVRTPDKEQRTELL
jgi:hypothetical protein